MANDDAKQLQEDLKELERLGQKLGKSVNFENLKNDAKAVEALLQAWRKEVEELNREFTDLSSTFKNVLDDLRNFNDISNRVNRSFKTLGGLADKLKYDAEDISKLNRKDLENLQKKAQTEVSNLKLAKESLDYTYQNANLKEKEKDARERGLKTILTEIAQYKELQGIFDENNNFRDKENNYIYKLLDLTKARLKEEEKIRKNLGLTGALYKGISTTLQKLGVDSTIIEDMGKKLEEAAKKGQVGIRDLIKVIEGGLTEAFQDPLFKFALGLKMVKSGINDLKKAFESWKEFDKTIVESARSLGMARNELKDYITTGVVNQDKFNEKFEDGYLGATQIAKSIQDMNGQLGLSVQFSQDATNEFAKMTGAMGLTAEEASKIYNLGLLTNTSLKDTNKSIADGIISAQRRTGVQVNERQVLQEIGKLSAGITAKFQQNPKALAEAVVQAKALGTNLETIDKIGESLLNFESSIESELKAELITGKQLNLEKARYAALTGDQVTLMNELANQVGTLNDFENMNVIAQKSLAEAFGMSRDELADMLKKQEVFNKLGDVSKMSAKEQLALAKKRGISESDSLVINLKQQAATETLAAAFDNIKMTLADLLDGPLKLVAETMSYIAKHAGLVYAALGAIVGLSIAKTIGGLVLMFSQLAFFSRANATNTTLQNAGLIEQNALTATNVGQNEALIALKTEQTAATQLQNAALIEQSALLAENIAANTTLSGLKTEQSVASGIQATAETEKTVAEGAQIPLNTTLTGLKAEQSIASGIQAVAETETTIAEGAQIPLNTTNAALKGEEALAAVTTAAASSFGLGTVAIIAGIAAILGAVAGMALKPKKLAKGGIVPATPGGQHIIAGEAGQNEAIIPLNSPKAGEMLGINNQIQPTFDTSAITEAISVIGNTNKNLNTASPSIGINKPIQPTFDTSAITDAISALSNTVSNLINRQQPTPQFALHVDGKQLGTVVGKQMETGTSQNIYTGYKIA